LQELLKASGDKYFIGKARLEDRAAIERDIEECKPTFVLNAAGVTGRPNVDWCEDHKQDTVRGNILGTINLADVCYQKGGIQCTVFASGCIYEYDAEHQIGGKTFTEEDEPNYLGSFYSKTKILSEKTLIHYPNVLVLRLRMPVSDDLHPRSFLTKISKYERVVNIPNAISILHDLLPISIDMTKKKRTGIYNFTNPGAISHNDLLELYKEYINSSFTWKNFTVEEQAKILKAGRSNNELNVSKLLAEYPQLLPIKEAAREMFKRMQLIEGKK